MAASRMPTAITSMLPNLIVMSRRNSSMSFLSSILVAAISALRSVLIAARSSFGRQIGAGHGIRQCFRRAVATEAANPDASR